MKDRVMVNGRWKTTDGLQSLVTGMGDPERDKSASVVYTGTMLSDLQLSNAYRSSWIARKIVDIPAMDSLRKWRKWSASPEHIKLLEAEEKRLNLRQRMLQTAIFGRLWGGAGLYIGTPDQEITEPLNPKAIKRAGLLYLTPFTRKELASTELQQDPFAENYGRPPAYQVSGGNAASQEVHHSRIVLQFGSALPEIWGNQGALQGWSDSVLQTAFDTIKQSDSTAANIATMVFEANVDVFGIPDFINNLSDPDYEQLILQRMRLSATAKGITGAVLHDSEEEFNRKQLNFTALPNVLQSFLLLVAGAADIPLTRFLGQSPSGLSTTGEGDMKNYYDKVQSMQELIIGPAMHLLDECLIRSAIGSRPDGISYEWNPLEQMNESEISEIGERTSSSVSKLVEAGIYTADELREPMTNHLDSIGLFPGLQDSVSGRAPEDDGFDVGDAAPRPLYICRPVKNANAIIKWAKSQGFKNIVSPDQMHVTIAYSKQAIDWMAMSESWQDELVIKSGGPRMVDLFGEGARVLLFNSYELEHRHREVIRAGGSFDFDDYQPHITISYSDADLDQVKAYSGEIVLGPEVFEDIDPSKARSNSH